MTLEGEVTYPGEYGIQEGEKLSSVLKRAGGFRSTSYPTGAVLVRTRVRELEEKSRNELIRQIESTAAGARVVFRLQVRMVSPRYNCWRNSNSKCYRSCVANRPPDGS